MNAATSPEQLRPSASHMRELTLRGCEVARMAAAATAAGVSTGSADALYFIRGCEEELDELDRQINEEDSGSTILKKNPRSLHPSMLAAARSSGGMLDSKKDRQMMRFHTDTAVGSVTAQIVL